MTRTENENDLVLGNKQLLSAFFVVVALLGVFFTAGYIIGRNTGAKSATTDAAANASPATEAAQRTVSRGVEPAVEPPAAKPEPAPETANEASVQTKPVQKPAAEEGVPEPVGAVSAQVTPGHQYLQLMAVKRPVADNMVKLLKGRGYPALLGESSKPELFRVLVGPFTDMATLAKTKAGLKSAGFESVIAK